MLNILFAPFLFTCIKTVAGWTYTNYYRGAAGVGYSTQVYPTDHVTATSTSISTTFVIDQPLVLGQETTYLVTFTSLFLPPNASACSYFYNCALPQTTSTTSSIDTSYYVPVVVSAPSSCTKTSFLYTTAQSVWLYSISMSIDFSQQATESSEALFITTYIYTLSTNLGGQAATTTRCDVYLKDGAVLGLKPVDEAYYLNQCVDPRRFLCAKTSTVASGGCPITGGTYPPNGQTGGVGGTSVATASPTSRGGVSGLRALASQGLLLLMLPMSVLVLSILF